MVPATERLEKRHSPYPLAIPDGVASSTRNTGADQ